MPDSQGQYVEDTPAEETTHHHNQQNIKNNKDDATVEKAPPSYTISDFNNDNNADNDKDDALSKSSSSSWWASLWKRSPPPPTTPVCPQRQTSSFFSRWTYAYMNPMVARGARRNLVPEEFPLVERDDEADMLSSRLLEEWDKEVAKYGRHAKLWRVSLKVFGFRFALAGLAYFTEGLVQIAQGFLLGEFLKWFQDPDGTDRAGYLYAMGLAFLTFSYATLHHVEFFLSMRLGMQMRVGFIAAVYRKCLRLSVGSTGSTGLIVNLVSNDVQRFEDAAPFAHFAWIAPVELILVTYFLYVQISWAAFAAIGSLLAVIPMQMLIARQFAKLRTKLVAFRDERIKSLSDMLAGIMVVKLYAWEIPFVHRINALRDRETAYIKSASILRALNEALYFASSGLTSMFGFLTFYLIGGVLTPARTFTCLTYLANVRLAVTNFFPKALQFGSESWVSMKRIEEFLLLPEIEQIRRLGGDLKHKEDPIDAESDTMVVMKHGTFSWGGTETGLGDKYQIKNKTANTAKPAAGAGAQDPTTTTTPGAEDQPVTVVAGHDEVPISISKRVLHDITLSIRRGQVLGVCGPVGSGKSSLLLSILGELVPSSPETSLTLHPHLHTIAYTSQMPWILPGTIKDNILFGRAYDRKRFEWVVSVCAMTRDASRWTKGLDTLVGERGVTLSGGQKARVALARAVYSDSPLVLLDDPLSAVDTKVGRQLFSECIRGALKDRAVVLVTHQLQFVRECDQVLVLEGGRCSGVGKYEDVMNGETEFCKVLREYWRRPGGLEGGVEDEAESDQEDVVEEDADKVADEDESTANDASTSKEMTKETMTTGSISLRTYYDYLTAGTPKALTLTVLPVMLIMGQALSDVANWWLAYWSQKPEDEKRRDYYPHVFVGLVMATVVVSLSRAELFFWVSWKSGVSLFRQMCGKVFLSPMWFFWREPHGRILNRFSKDINLVDEMLPMTFFDFIQCAFMVLGTVIISVCIIPYILVLVPFIIAGFLFFRHRYIQTSRQIKRIEAITRSPVYSFVPATLEGLSIVRAFGSEQRFTKIFVDLQNDNTRMFFAFLSCARWLGFRLDYGSAVFMTILSFGCVGLRGSLGLKAGIVGLLLSYAIQLTGTLQWCVRQSAEVENLMVSVERVMEYTELEEEESHDDIGRYQHRETSQPLSPKWPETGHISLQGMSLTYPFTDTRVLKDLQLTIPPGTKVGIVGRTGAGKSSFLQALFRLVPYHPPNSLLIDSIPTDTVPLRDLRGRMSIIPQEPFCFKGTVRFNIDPSESYTDTDIYRALEVVDLKSRLGTSGLETDVAENGSNFSVGERQLMCLARAILRSSTIIVMDEATSSVDLKTDSMIQTAIRGENGMFKDATVLTIAHRLNTVIDYDMIVVMEDGRIVEWGSAWELLRKPLDSDDVLNTDTLTTTPGTTLTTTTNTTTATATNTTDDAPASNQPHQRAWFKSMVSEMGQEAQKVLYDLAWSKELQTRRRTHQPQQHQQNEILNVDETEKLDVLRQVGLLF
ncbi:hypothetical protein BC832DRAFT_531702 [Gaertneriomyces semiglobifer]|nr:hypothetical protein BC832DRAFT_531702 [Gaertneriomyces semiglobifer]